MVVIVGEMESKKIKVAYFIGSLNRGGTEMLTLDICRKKEYAPFEIILIYRNDGDLTEEFKASGVPMFKIKPKIFKIGYFVQLRRLIKREKIDVVHAQTFLNCKIILFSLVFSQVKVVSSFHGFSFANSSLLNRLIVMKGARELVFVSQYVMDYYLKRNDFCDIKKCDVVYDGVNIEKITKKYSKPDFLSKNQGNILNKFHLVMVGNFVDGRSQSFVCNVVKLLRDQGVDNFDFYFIGKRVENEASRYDECYRYCKENGLMDCVHFVGGRSDVYAILQHVDGFIYSSEHDTFGIAVVEAMLSGLPVVVNDWEVMKEITQNGRFAALYETDNTEDCCEKIKDLINNFNYYQSKARSNVELIMKSYSIERHIDALKSVYDKCVL